jgi:hypothetical protein
VDRYRFIDKVGTYVFGERTFEDANSFSEGLAAVSVGGAYGFVDTHGRTAIEFEFSQVRDFSEGLAKARY